MIILSDEYPLSLASCSLNVLIFNMEIGTCKIQKFFLLEKKIWNGC